MRTFAMLLILGCCGIATADGVVIEPETKSKFPAMLDAGGAKLMCTGTSVRQVYGMDIYGIAHYGDAAASPEAGATPEQQLEHWMKAAQAKAIAIRFVFFADEQNLRQFCESSLEAAGYSGDKRDKFLDVFARDYRSGSEIRMLANASGTLRIEIDGEDQDAWEDPELVRALWRCWLGEKSPLKDRKGLVTPPVPQTAAE